ncbi:DEAD/DEAH box helicase domain-containing protein [Ditylenchus destructor]|uniref:DEAD/DEAH box helicase domain-containing protein n=1 Tax=Ditylenchus destructor TaxID=166010 RepID=A0AAD4RDR7_9BILA|nr:DEAD/DEAH box helicase domain-containing protein [Ditylenchus destructor]
MLTSKQKTNLLFLYEDEILSRMAADLSKIGKLQDMIPEDKMCNLRANNSSDMGLAREMWELMQTSALNETLYERVLTFLKDVDFDLHSMICLERSNNNNSFGKGLLEMLKHMDGMMKALTSLEIVICTLREVVQGFEHILNPIWNRFKDAKITETHAKKLILRTVPNITIFGYEHLLYAISKCGQEADNYVNQIYRNFANEYEYRNKTTNNPRGLYYEIGPTNAVKEVMQSAATLGINSPYARCARIGQVPRPHFRACTVGIVQETPLNLREYQKELVHDAVENRNTIICAPTGSGKTYVAAYIVRNHLLHSNSRRKVCFFVPTTTLVEQQEEVLRRFVGHFASVKGVSGITANSVPVRKTIEATDVLVVTPQIIVNLLMEKPMNGFDDVSFTPFGLSAFSLILFDEAHHTNESHPYNVLMKEYHLKKAINAYKTIPQIVGLTASLGIGGSSNHRDALQYTLQMCANLDSSSISRVRKNVDDLKKFASETREEIITVDSSDLTNLGTFKIIQQYMRDLESEMLKIPEATSFNGLRKSLTCPSSNYLHQGYENWICGLLARTIPECTDLPQKSRALVTQCLEQLRILYYTIEYLNLFSSDIALEYVRKALEKHPHIDLRLKGLLETLQGQPEHESAMLIKLRDILRTQLDNHINSRILIFAPKRDQCKLMAELISNTTPYFANYLTGQASYEEGGSNAAEQKKKVIDFKTGTVKILCVTSVAEEGLDIEACNLVIQYSNVTNEIGHVQRRGRGRKENSKSILLTSDRKVKERAQENAQREIIMTEILDDIDMKPTTWFKEKVAQKAEELASDIFLQISLQKQATVKLNEKNKSMKYRLLCRQCDAFITSSDNVAVFCGGQYATVDPGYWSRVFIHQLPVLEENKRWENMASPHVGVHHCMGQNNNRTCRMRLGRIVLFRDVHLPIISCKSVVFVEYTNELDKLNFQGRRFPLSQWKDVKSKLFLPKELTGIQLAEMQRAAEEKQLSSELKKI